MALPERTQAATTPFIFEHGRPEMDDLRAEMNQLYLADEAECMEQLLPQARLDDATRRRIVAKAESLVEVVRKKGGKKTGISAFMQQYDLSSQEGVVLMCLSEALIRVPDSITADKLIQDKIASGDWRSHLGESDSLFVNASTWGLMLTGGVVKVDKRTRKDVSGFMSRLTAKMGEPMIRGAMRQAMRILGFEFVMGRDIKEALKRARSKDHRDYRHSFDMLGEAALTWTDADRYWQAYADAIDATGKSVGKDETIWQAHSISVKLSALHPRYEFANREAVLDELTPRLLRLAERARDAGIQLTVDAEEADRLDLSLEVIEAVYRSPSLEGWEGFGLAIQAYQKRCIKLVDWLNVLTNDVGRKMPVRLVKGAYWDNEIKWAQVEGEHGYPVFTRKVNTDVSFLACAKKLLQECDQIYPQFATHNAHTLASILEMAEGRSDYEFQRLHGMGEELYEEVMGERAEIACRVYAPVGRHKELLPYLVRRLLENGANTSFVNHIMDSKVPVSQITRDPVAEVEKLEIIPHPKIPLPKDIYRSFGQERENSAGVNLTDPDELAPLAESMEKAMEQRWEARALIGGKIHGGGKEVRAVDPSDNRRSPGVYYEPEESAIREAIGVAHKAQPEWDATPAAERAAILRKAADLYEEHMGELMALCSREAGKTIPDGVAEVREAVDFLRYYANQCEEKFGAEIPLPGPTGEKNTLRLTGKGVFVCISPWNFPLAIFTGQVTAALAAGNAVLAKPAEQTSLIGSLAVKLLHKAGIPGEVLNFLPSRGSTIGKVVTPDERIIGVAFTGSTETAHVVNQTLAQRKGVIPTLIAETGGQNAMLVDSSALPEQVADDVVQSAFHSAGQRCSALRVLFLQEEIAPRVLEILSGYMDTLIVGDPALLRTDIGPVIDDKAYKGLKEHVEWVKTQGKLIKEAPLSAECANGTFLAPVAVEIDDISLLEREQFGPVLHVVRYKAKDLDKVIDSINKTGYGLTLGIHTRIDSEADYIQRRIKVGNAYVNRNMVGAVVGVQPFGGQGLSGTGPKAGGPHYMLRFANERTLTINTAAVGGNASLLALSDE
ncbi:RHH-type proline utilization regulon transcriptional repressor/proline dehydrogenase/delta 1-pyrroline-5-carboxylate dehydrogenase [Natronospira proteinivora]|uniref:Bifunctional protein PutA n=2 Tax=Natronospira proteinivora TaxID=1807133 RepID=A0ABT1G4Y0_9GAMM|nr:RHH-type proline utilization regulon transcriptional repressor/proline dehydrogenase/delta 1-pyrroline-5-carboxylate dehydrogenase [Natronospira proteinivora]